MNVTAAIGDFFKGLHYEYPICCVTHFAWDVLWQPYGAPALRHGLHGYVPCGKCKRTGYVPQRILDRWSAERDAKRCKLCWDNGYVLVGPHHVTYCECELGLAYKKRAKEQSQITSSERLENK